MYSTLLCLHSIVRWVLLTALLFSVYRAYRGVTSGRPFSKKDNSLRHWTATIAHVQLIIGIFLYIKSPVVQYFFANFHEAMQHADASFFGLVHISLMFISIVILTIGSAMAKRKPTNQQKYKTMFMWFGLALLIILVAVPWPFSPLAQRPYFRSI
jgi:hypothetical protein